MSKRPAGRSVRAGYRVTRETMQELEDKSGLVEEEIRRLVGTNPIAEGPTDAEALLVSLLWGLPEERFEEANLGDELDRLIRDGWIRHALHKLFQVEMKGETAI